MLPHAPHPRQVVLELRELDLELALGAARVLGEDVEDQLRSVDDARLEQVLEAPLLGRVELVVDEQRLGLGLGEGVLQLLELPLADVCARVRAGAGLDERATASTPAVRASSRISASSSPGSAPFGRTATTNPRSAFRPGAGSGWRCVTE